MGKELKTDARLKEALYYTAENSGASVERARGVIIGATSALMGHCMEWKDAWTTIMQNLPYTFRLECIPACWTAHDIDSVDWIEDINDIVPPFSDFWNNIPGHELPKQEDLIDKYLWVAGQIDSYIRKGRLKGMNMAAVFHRFRTAGTQHIAEFSIYNLDKPKGNSVNWHGQNTSQWVFAGGLLVQDKRVSIHT